MRLVAEGIAMALAFVLGYWWGRNALALPLSRREKNKGSR